MNRFVLLILLTAAAALAQDRPVIVAPGETALGDLGRYRIGYQSYGQAAVDLPAGWSGDIGSPSGVGYLPNESVLGRDAILLHSPWKVPPGKAWVDYRLLLPRASPLALAFGIAMRPDLAVPGKSDGVTFSAYAIADGRERELMREHWAKGEWKDFRFDLAEFAGREVTVRFQTEPGPANSPSFDFSYFGRAIVTAGPAGTGPDIDALLAGKALKAVERVGMLPLANAGDRGIVPGNLLPCANAVTADADGIAFTYDAADATLRYEWRPKTGTLDDVTVRVDRSDPFRPAGGGGITAAGPDGIPWPATGGRALRREVDTAGKRATVVWEYPAEAGGLTVAWTLGIRGKALTVEVAAEKPGATAFSLGQVNGAPLRRVLAVPYLAGTIDWLAGERIYAARYLDWTVSNSSECPQGTASYHKRTDGTRNLLRESGYVTVSPHVGEVLPNLPSPASPYLALLGPRVMLDIWGHHRNSYAGDAELLRELKDNGVDHIAIIQHVWQRYGYDVKLPDHLPANPEFATPEARVRLGDLAGDEGLAAFGKAAVECGYVWSLHENYIDLYPDAPSFDPAAVVLREDGSRSPAWYNEGTKVQSFGLKCNRAGAYAAKVAPEAHRRFGTNAAYLDVHTCVPPWHQLDHEAGQPLAGMARAKVQFDTELFQYMREAHAGPLFGEGGSHFYWAGRMDGVEAQVQGGEQHRPFLDFDLLKIHPQMVNHGMGYYARWFERGADARWGLDAGSVEQYDKYRAQEIAYGHAGFVGSEQVANVQWVAKEHHLMHPIQRLYGTARVRDIRYEVEGRLVPASVALALDRRLRQCITYDSGLSVWVNWAAEPWPVAGRTLPQWGFLAKGPDTEVGTVLKDGRYADFADCPEYLFADARTAFRLPHLDNRADVEPTLKSFRHLGGNRIEVTYEWRVGQTLTDDWHCFVHGTGVRDGSAREIAFQQDHQLPKPTSQWQPGERIVDGPYTITVPATAGEDTYDLLIGLYTDRRLHLKGRDVGGDRIWLTRLAITRAADGTVATIAETAAPPPADQAVKPADFAAHLNPPGFMVDFGVLATDGSVKVNRASGGLTVFPYPREKPFTVRIDLARAAGAPANAKPVVRAQAAATCADLGPVPAAVEGGRLVFRVGVPGAGRYIVTW